MDGFANMAADNANDDQLLEGVDEGKAPKSSGGIVKIVLIAIGVSLFLAINIGITVFLINSSGTSNESAADSGGHVTDVEKGTDEHGAAKEDAGDAAAPIYYKLDPTFVVNYQAQDDLRFLQVTVEVMARDEKIIALVEQHMPVIRNNLIVLFSSQDFTTISTRVGKERLRAQVLAEVQKVLKEETGRPGIEAVYFTSFVMQ